jgi:hypothetical protein
MEEQDSRRRWAALTAPRANLFVPGFVVGAALATIFAAVLIGVGMWMSAG